MLSAVHTLIYSDDPAATRAFLRDVLDLPHVASGGPDADWLIFATGPSELGVHPTSGEGYAVPRQHQISFMVDDIAATKAELEARGAVFSGEIKDQGFGLVVMMQVPGADDVMVYQPSHQTAYNL
jgi:catechol 2,3-dioxygenase-like lactoylglutathione lyase family enzyme